MIIYVHTSDDTKHISIDYDNIKHYSHPATAKRIVDRLTKLMSKTPSSTIKAIFVEIAINMLDNIDRYSKCNISNFDVIKLDDVYITVPAGNTKDKSIYISITVPEDEPDVFVYDVQAAVFKYPLKLLDYRVTTSGWQSADYTAEQVACMLGNSGMEYNPAVLVDAINKYGPHVTAHSDIQMVAHYAARKKDTYLENLIFEMSKKAVSRFNMNLLMLIASQYLSGDAYFSIDETVISISDTKFDITMTIKLIPEVTTGLAYIDEITCFNNKYRDIDILIESVKKRVPDSVLDSVRGIIPLIPINVSSEHKYNVTELGFILSNIMKLVIFTRLYEDSFSYIEDMPKPDMVANASLIKMKNDYFWHMATSY